MSSFEQGAITLRLQKMGLPPHAASRTAAAFIANNEPEDLGHATLDELASEALAQAEGPRSSGLGRRPGATLGRSQARARPSHAHAGPAKEESRGRAREALPVSSPTGALAGSPAGKHGSPSPMPRRKAPPPGLYEELLAVKAQTDEATAALKAAKAAESAYSFRAGLDAQMRIRQQKEDVANQARMVAAAAAEAEREAVRAEEAGKARDKRAAAAQLAADKVASAAQADAERAAAASAATAVDALRIAEARRQADVAENARLARVASKRAEVKAFMSQNESEVAAKAVGAARARAEEAELVRAAGEAAAAAEAVRVAGKAARDAAMAAKLARMGDTFKLADTRDAEAAARAEAEADRIAAEKQAAADKRAAAHAAALKDDAAYIRLQLAEKAAAREAAAAVAAGELAAVRQGAAEARAEAAAKAGARRAAAERERRALEEEIAARRAPPPSGSAVDAALNASWLAEQQRVAEGARQAAAALLATVPRGRR
jgi:hypothetical protein